MNWLVVIPAWGPRCLATFERGALPAILAATPATMPLRFLVHTDNANRLRASMTGLDVEFRDVPQGRDPHHRLGAAHREGIAAAKTGEAIAFVNADMVGSVEIFAAAERRFAQGKRLIMMGGTRTIGALAPHSLRSAELLRWSMKHAHPATLECVFGTGHSPMCSTVYFRRGDDVVLHAFHLHPFALLVDRPLSFAGATIDRDLQDNYSRDEIHVVTDANEAAFAEMSPPDRLFGHQHLPMSMETIARWMPGNASSELHYWFFEHAIAICGDGGDIGDRGVVRDVLRHR
jgi:hypothetical protein